MGKEITIKKRSEFIFRVLYCIIFSLFGTFLGFIGGYGRSAIESQEYLVENVNKGLIEIGNRRYKPVLIETLETEWIKVEDGE